MRNYTIFAHNNTISITNIVDHEKTPDIPGIIISEDQTNDLIVIILIVE